MISRNGFIIPRGEFLTSHRKTLTVRPVVNGEFGFPPPPFRVYRASQKSVALPRFYGTKMYSHCRDCRTSPIPVKIPFVGTLRESTRQPEALDHAMKAFDEVGGGILCLPCGYGKTTVSLAIASKVGLRTMIIVHKEFLASQWEERIRQFCPGASIGRVQQNRKEIDKDFVIVMLQSLSQKEYSRDDFDSVGLMIVDEAHHICARVFSQALFKLCPKYTLGLTATPNRADGLTEVLFWFLGPIFFAIERENQGQVIVHRVDYKDESFQLAPPTTRMGKISLAEMITILTENHLRNKMIVNMVMKIKNRNILILTDRRNHCTLLQEMLQNKGKDVGLYMGGMKQKDLKQSEKASIIIGTFSQAHEGLDIPKLDTLILATPKSNIKQAVGRILRETPGKINNPEIWDIRDHWALLHAMYYKRMKVYKEGGFQFDDFDERNPFKGKCLL